MQRSFRNDAQLLDKERKGESGGRASGGGSSRGTVSGGHPSGGGVSRGQAHPIYKQPQRDETCRVCGVLETEGETGLYDGHLSSWPFVIMETVIMAFSPSTHSTNCFPGNIIANLWPGVRQT